ncbi:rRNA maturation RNase YbeY [Leptospira ilyithenensis]|uniref:Endoribonuclease YbeY n=1 Tax=Leptospira ilyithenensis TaxID=2484901 RepID=A0A4R9LQA1_9LEPT|nr:rRNA maturation RNase YbeY [Leptospira ilyithenensis]TGN10010.1 rRNA maturation RNase YbeY [Leptospira ilyithenensis]
MNPPFLSIRWNENVEGSFLDEDLVKKNLELILLEIKPKFLKSIELDILIVTDSEMTNINRERRNINRTTDVLSFPLFQEFPPLPHQMIGEIVISFDTCKRQAIEIGHTDVDEFYRLLVHGVLHLFGYDHETSLEDEVVMKNKEDECLALIFGEDDGT